MFDNPGGGETLAPSLGASRTDRATCVLGNGRNEIQGDTGR